MNEIEHLFNQGHVIVFKWKNTKNWPVEYVSENVSRIIGYSREEILADTFVYSEIIHPDDLIRVVKEVSDNSKVEIKQFSHHPYRIITKSSKIIWVDDFTSIQRNEKGDITHYFGYIIDITEKIKSDVQNKKLSTAVHQSGNCIVIADTDGNIEYVNPMFEKLTGYKAKEVIGKNPRILNAGVYSKKYYKKLWDTISSGKTWRGDFCNKKKNGELYWERANITPVKDDEGKIINYIALKEDITSFKMMEDELQQRERYLSALNQASTLFLKDDAIPYQRFAEIIGSASEANRTYIFINQSNEKNELITSQIAEYCSKGIKPEIGNPVLQNLLFNTWGKRWEDTLSKGNIISGKISDFPQSEKDLLQPQDIKAILILPLIIGDEFFGFIGFDNCISEREWTSSELEFLKVGANSLQQSIKKNKTLKLLQSENLRFRTTMDAIDALVYVADLQTFEVLFLNKYGRNIFGDQIGNKCYKIFHKDKLGPCNNCTNKFLLDRKGNPKEPYVWEYQNTITKYWYQCRDQAIRWTDGRLVRLEIATNITERKMIEVELEKSEAKYRNLIDESNDAIYLLYENNFEIINKKFCEMFGVTEKEVQNPDFDFIELVSPKSRNLIMERSKSNNKDKLEIKYEFTALNKDGKELDVEASVSYMKYKKGIAVQGIIRDLTKRKQLEQRMLQNQKLESLGELSGGIAHDFNNILSSIYGFAELAVDKLTKESKTRYYVEQVLKSAEKGKDLVNHIMSFTRKGNANMEDVNLGETIKECIKLIKPLLPSTIRIRQSIQTDQSFISGNSTHIYQILINLCTNASYAMGGNTGLIGITLDEINLDNKSCISPSLRPGKHIRLIISDTGSGMSKDAQQKIFDPFFTTKPIGEGTGMGLSVVYRIVESHRGDISVHSEEGKGTVFTILFPKIESFSKERIDDVIPLVGGTERILFVDDEENIVEIFDKILTRAGYDVSATSSSRNAIKLFKKNKSKFDLVITDQTMPEITGIQLAEEIKKKRKDIPIILCSGYSDNNLKFKSVDQNFEKFLNKPVKQIELLGSIRQVLDKSKLKLK